MSQGGLADQQKGYSALALAADGVQRRRLLLIMMHRLEGVIPATPHFGCVTEMRNGHERPPTNAALGGGPGDICLTCPRDYGPEVY